MVIIYDGFYCFITITVHEFRNTKKNIKDKTIQ